MIVVDVGCMTQGPEHSTDVLIDRFRPRVYFGFDPHPEQGEGVDTVGPNNDTVRVFRRAAAWTYDGTLPFVIEGITTGLAVASRNDPTPAEAVDVDCVDLPAFLSALPPGEVVLKLDCEGAEYPLLERIRARDLDARLALVLVEWHPPETAHGLYVPPARRPELRCLMPAEEW